MIVIEYNKLKVSVPENWDDISLGFYESFCAKKPETARERVEYVAHICRVESDVLMGWPAEVFNMIVSYIGFLFEDNASSPSPSVQIGGVKYIVPIEDELSLGAWVDADDVQKNGEAVLSNILAIVCRPAGEDYECKNNEGRAAMFAAQPASKVLGVLAFFLHYKAVLDRRTAAYLKIAELPDLLPRNIGFSQSLGGGIRLCQIWRIIKYWTLTVLLKYRLRRFSRSCNTGKIKTTRKKRSVN